MTTTTEKATEKVKDVASNIEDFAERAQKAFERGLEKIDPQVLQWGESALASAAIAAGPVRRSFKTQPRLTVAGVAAIAAGGIMLAIAISRDLKSKSHAN